MKAITYDVYGDPVRVLRLADVPEPTIGDRGVLVRVRASSVNPADLAFVTGLPGLVRAASGIRRPRSRVPGRDYSGVVEAVGASVTGISVGDEVYGEGSSTFAELVALRPGTVARKPANLSFEQAAAVPLAGNTAWQALDQVRIGPGARVLVNGAAGGVGHFAVQIAKARGCDVTAVCSAGNADVVRGLGADRVIDYVTTDYTTLSARYHVIVDAVRTHPLADVRGALVPDGTYLAIGTSPTNGPGSGGLLGPIPTVAGTAWRGVWSRPQRLVVVSARANAGLAAVTALVESGAVTPYLDEVRPLGEVPEALARIATHHVRGKIAISVRPDGPWPVDNVRDRPMPEASCTSWDGEGTMTTMTAGVSETRSEGGAPVALPTVDGRPFTSDDLDAMPDDGHRYEVVDGVLIVSPSPTLLHQRASARLFLLLEAHCPEELEVLYAPLDVRLAEDTTVQPDLLVLPTAADPLLRVERPPLLAAEIRSPSTGLYDRTLKQAVYERHGVAQYWLVDPAGPSLTVLRLGPDGRYDSGLTVSGEEAYSTDDPYPITLRPADLLRR